MAVSAELASWLQDYFERSAKELISQSPSAASSVKELRESLGGAARKDDFQGWLASQSQPVSEAVVRIKVAPSSGQAPGKIPDELLEELAKALAADLNAELAAADEALFEFLLSAKEGLWQVVSEGIVAEIKEQELGAAGKAGLYEPLHASAWKAMNEAFAGLYEAMEADGGYEWLLTRKPS